ncbi:hypothetical protein OAF54_00885 [bacterium]|nr:hypothetical protein [bacterium]
MSSPKITMPSSPDGSALAAQQGQNNLEAAIATSLLNQTNEITPYGTVTYSRNEPTGGNTPRPVGTVNPPMWRGGGPNGTSFGNAYGANRGTPQRSSGFGSIGGMDIPSFTRTVTLSPAQQAKFDAQNRIEGAMADTAEAQIGRVQGALGQGVNTEGLPDMVSGIDAAPIIGFNPQGNQIQSSLRGFDPLANIDTSYLQGAGVQDVQRGISQQGLFGLDPNQVQAQREGGLQDVRRDFAEQGRELEQATFDRGRSLLEPQFGKAMEQAEVRLSERGLPLSSQAGSDILGGVQSQQNRALNELALSSIEAGRQEQARLFGQDMSLRGQQFGEQMGDASLFNQAGQQAFGQSSQARNQLVNERLNQATLANQAGAQAFGQQTGLRGQQFAERQAEADFANQARNQAFSQGLLSGQFANQAQQQQFGQGMQANALNNQLQQQSYNQAAGNAQLQNAARQNALQEQAYLRNMPLNDMAALMGQSGGIQLPQFQQSPNVAVQAGDLIGATMGLNQQNIDVQKANQAASGGLLGGLMGLGGSLGSAWIGR